MEITVYEFLSMAFDNTFEFCIYDFSKEKTIFDSSKEDELPDEIGEMYVESWELNHGRIILNINSDSE